jgi:hypothetical protein
MYWPGPTWASRPCHQTHQRHHPKHPQRPHNQLTHPQEAEEEANHPQEAEEEANHPQEVEEGDNHPQEGPSQPQRHRTPQLSDYVATLPRHSTETAPKQTDSYPNCTTFTLPT